MRKYKQKVGSKKKKYQNFSEDVLKKALSAIQEGATYREVQDQFGVPKSTLHRRIKGTHKKTMGGQTALSKKEEEVFAHHLIAVSEWGFSFSTLHLRLIVKGYLDKNKQEIKVFQGQYPWRRLGKKFFETSS